MLVLVIGLAGGVALGSIAGARRTASSYSTFLAATNPSDLMIEPAGGSGPPQADLAQRLTNAVRKYPQVTRVESYEALPASIVKHGKVEPATLGNVILVSSVDGLLFDQDRFTVTSGRMADPARADEVMVTETAAAALGLHLGSTVPVSIDTGRARARATG